MVNYPYLAYLPKRLLRRHIPAEGVLKFADRSRILHPGEMQRTKPAIYLSGQLERIQSISSHSDKKREESNIYGHEWMHRPTMEYIFRQARVVDSHWYAKGMRVGLTETKPALLRSNGDFESLKEAALVCTYIGNEYFGVCLRSDLVTAMIAEDPARNVAVRKRKSFPHEAGYRAALGCPAPRIVTNAAIDELVVYEDVGHNAYKRQRFETLRARLRASVSARCAGSGVYIRRPADGAQRRLCNEAEIEACLEKRGFTVVDPQRLSSEDILRLSLDAPIVIGVEGSHLAHGIYPLHASGTLVVLEPPYRFSTAFKDFTDCLDMSFAFVVGESAENGFVVNTGDLERLLDHVGRRS